MLRVDWQPERTAMDVVVDQVFDQGVAIFDECVDLLRSLAAVKVERHQLHLGDVGEPDSIPPRHLTQASRAGRKLRQLSESDRGLQVG